MVINASILHSNKGIDMLRNRSTTRKRSGATIVETALVLSLLFLFLFAIFEYCRFLMVYQMLSNAARDGARYAATHGDKSANFVNTNEDGFLSIRNYVVTECKGANNWIENFDLQVFVCDPTGLYNATAPVITPASGSTAWNTRADDQGRQRKIGFTDRFTVRITGTFRPNLPVMWLPNGGSGGMMVSMFGGNSIPLVIDAVSGME
jgi:hypothetical protein